MDEDLQNDFDIRRNAFIIEYKALIDKYQVDFLSTPMLVPTDKGTWSLQEFATRVDVINTKDFPTKSPLQFGNIKL